MNTLDLDSIDVSTPEPRALVSPDAPTEKQLKFGRSLYIEVRDLAARFYSLRAAQGDDNAPEAHLAWTETTLEGIGTEGARAKAEGKRAFSRYIDDLIGTRDEWRGAVRSVEQVERAANPEAPAVPAGRYAIWRDGDDGLPVLRFYVVDRPTEGRWAGYVFVKRQASDDLYPVRDRDERALILAAIEEQGVDHTLRLYGQEIGQCGRCGRTLTNEESRAAGIGPVCAQGA